MDITTEEYTAEFDQELLQLFYRSIYFNRKEFETVRPSNNWIDRYRINNNSITKIAIHKGKIIASLGVIPTKCKVKGKVMNVGCFVDNCILPKFLDNYEIIFNNLFSEIENDMKQKGVNVICGWDYLKNIQQHKDFFHSMGFTWINGVNWFAGGYDFKGEYPRKWDVNLSLFWKIIFKLVFNMNRLTRSPLHHLPAGVKIREMVNSDIKKILKLSDNFYSDFELAPYYTIKEYKKIQRANNIHGIIAEYNSDIIGALTYITGAWSGWMFGKPSYSNNWKTFFTLTPDEFIITPKFQDTSVPTYMILELMKIKHPNKPTEYKKNYSFIADIFDRRINWRRESILKSGCIEAKADLGAILVKSLKKDLNLDTSKLWNLPARNIITPVREIDIPYTK